MNMNTNSNTYTIIYTTIIVMLVAAILAFVSQSLKASQEANEKADTISQMLTAAQFSTKADLQKIGNKAVLDKFAEEIGQAFTVGTDGQKISDLKLDEVYSPKQLKKQNYNIKDGSKAELPVFIFKNGVTVVPVYGAGLWTPSRVPISTMKAKPPDLVPRSRTIPDSRPNSTENRPTSPPRTCSTS